MSVIKTVLITAIILVMGFLAYSYYPQIKDMADSFNQPSVNESSTIMQFAKNLRFENSKISYFINSNCDENRKSRMMQAFFDLSNKSEILSFYQAQETNADILIGCSKESYQTEKNIFTAGEGGPTSYIELKEYSLIKKGKIILYQKSECSYPIVEMHELLHVLGFSHVSNKTSIMYPYANCNAKIDKEIVDIIKTIYSQQALADLFFSSLSYVKNGLYLNLSLAVTNQGIKEADNIKVKIDNILGEEFNVENLKPGETQEITISNMRMPSTLIEELRLSINYAENELDKENNIRVIKLV